MGSQRRRRLRVGHPRGICAGPHGSIEVAHETDTRDLALAF